MLFAPPDRRMAQVRRTEQLYDQIDPKLNYPFDFISYRITGYRSEATPTTLLMGQAILPDLRLVIDRLSHSAPIPVTQDESVETPQQLAQRLNVSTKTVTRWRDRGLRWRWIVPAGRKRKVIAFTASAIEQFLTQHQPQVDRATSRTHIAPETRQAIIRRARRIAQATGASLNRVAAHLAKKTSRAHQTIRLLLEHHDRDHPSDRIFIDHAPLSAEQKRLIARAYRRGVPMSQITHRFKRTRATVYRALRHRRAQAIGRLRIQYAPSPLFDRDNADQLILAQNPTDQLPPASQGSTTPVDDLPPEIQPLYDRPTLGPVQQRSLLLRFNYLKHKAIGLRDQLNRYDPRSADLDQIEQLIRLAVATRDLMITHTMPLILSVARRHLIDQTDQTTAHLIELLQMAMPVLVEAVERYDVTRPQTFTDYATWTLMQRFARHHASQPVGTVRAHRKLDGPASLKNLRDAAATRGVRLSTQA